MTATSDTSPQPRRYSPEDRDQGGVVRNPPVARSFEEIHIVDSLSALIARCEIERAKITSARSITSAH
jgi:hypothetical protein